MCCCTVNDRHLSFSHSVLLSSHGPDGPELFMIDPSGVSWVRNVCPYVLFNENVNYITCSLINFNFFNCSVASLEVSAFYYTCSINIKTKHMTRSNCFLIFFFWAGFLGVPWLCCWEGKASCKNRNRKT